MSDNFIAYLKREHARLDRALNQASRRTVPDQIAVARFKKLRLAVKDQIVQHERPMRDRAA